MGQGSDLAISTEPIYQSNHCKCGHCLASHLILQETAQAQASSRSLSRQAGTCYILLLRMNCAFIFPHYNGIDSRLAFLTHESFRVGSSGTPAKFKTVKLLFFLFLIAENPPITLWVYFEKKSDGK